MKNDKHAGNVVILRGATLWLIVSLALAWCLAAIGMGAPIIFKSAERVLQSHIDFSIMTALMFGIYAAKVYLPWHIRWSIVIGAFTNASVFLFMASFPVLLDAKSPDFAPEGMAPMIFHLFIFASSLVTTYGFAGAAVIILRSTFKSDD